MMHLRSATAGNPAALMAEFDTADRLLEVARAAHAAGYAAEAYAPFSIEGLAEALGVERSRIAPITFVAALAGGVLGYLMQWYSAVIDRPLNVGGRPLHSWPMFIPVAFELAVLCGALAALLAFIASAGLPRLRHPLFEVPAFTRATRDRFFLVLFVDDLAAARRWFQDWSPLALHEVPR